MAQDELLRLIDQAAKEGWKKLDLSRRELKELPIEISKLIQLETLTLGKQKKSRGGYVGHLMKILPPEIGQLKNLKALLIEGTQLETLPSEIGQLKNLQILVLRENRLKCLPKMIGRDCTEFCVSGLKSR